MKFICNVFIALVISIALAAPSYAQQEENSEIDTAVLGEKLKFDLVFGKDGASVTMVEYASLSCSHCKDFHQDIFLKIKEKYIDSGKVKFIFRHYPLNAPAFYASMLVECVADDRKPLFLDALFNSQSSWAYVKSPEELKEKLRTVAKIGGINSEKYDECISNKEREEVILKDQLTARNTLKVSSTPTLFINNEMFVGEKSLENITKSLDELLKESSS